MVRFKVSRRQAAAVMAALVIGLAAQVQAAHPAGAAASGMQPYSPSNTPRTYSTTSSSFGTATATIQQSSGQSTSPSWTYCASHAVDGTTCAGASHLPAGTVSSWVNQGSARLVTMPGGAQCYAHTNPSGVTWCYGGEPVQDSIGTTGGPFGTSPDTSVGELPNQGEAWWGSGGGPNDSASCKGMFDNAPTSSQASFSSCVQQFGTVTWDPSGSTVASIRSVADEMAWRIGAWNGNTYPGGVQCGSRTAIGGASSDSQAPNGLWMQWSSNPARGFWNCTQEDGAAGPPQAAWNGSSWYSRSYADWNGFGWYLVYYDYASFLETTSTAANGVATSITCNGDTSATTVSSSVPSQVQVAIDESNGMATFTDQNGTVLSQVSCVNNPSSRTTSPGSAPPPGPPPTTTPSGPPSLLASNYSLNVPVGQSGAVNVLSQNNFRGTPTLSVTSNATQPGTLDTDPNSVDFGYFTWSPTYVDAEQATYQMCDVDGCASGTISLNSDAVPATSSTTRPVVPEAANYTLQVQVGTTGSVNVLSNSQWTGTAALSLVSNANQPGTLDTNSSDAGFGTFTWSPTAVDSQDQAVYQLCDSSPYCANGTITLIASSGPAPSTTAPGPTPTGTPPSTACAWYCGQGPPTTAGGAPPPSPNVHLDVSPTAFPDLGQSITLSATASDPASSVYDLKIVRLDDGVTVADCGQVLTCSGGDAQYRPITKHYVAQLSYADGSPTNNSNEIVVVWGDVAVGLTACLTSAPCTDVTATPRAGQPAYLTATVHHASAPGNSQPTQALYIIDAGTREVVASCTPGETVCQAVVTEPAGVHKTYFADYVYQNNPGQDLQSNTVDVTWGAAPTTTTPATTAPPPATTTTTSPPATTTTVAPPLTSTEPPTTGPPSGVEPT